MILKLLKNKEVVQNLEFKFQKLENTGNLNINLLNSQNNLLFQLIYKMLLFNNYQSIQKKILHG